MTYVVSIKMQCEDTVLDIYNILNVMEVLLWCNFYVSLLYSVHFSMRWYYYTEGLDFTEICSIVYFTYNVALDHLVVYFYH